MEKSGPNRRPNERQECPNCHHFVPMLFVFPTTQFDPCVEKECWRFQRCFFCHWSGDVTTGRAINFRRYHGLLFVDGIHYAGGLLGYMRQLDLCP